MAQGSSNPTSDIKKIAGSNIAVNAGNADAGTQRVVLATNQSVLPISDNGGSITVDGTFWQATQPVSLAQVPSHHVTNAGTFAVQVTSAPTTAVTGTFWQTTQPVSAASLPLPTGAATETTLSAVNTKLPQNLTVKAASTAAIATDPALVVAISPNNTISATIAANSSINVNQIAGTATATGNGVVSAGVQRVAIASDNTAFAVNANQSGVWNITNISGTVQLPTGAATAANQATEITALQLLDDAVGTSGTAIATGMYRVGGTDGTNNRLLSVNTSGHVNIADGGNSITVDGTVSVSGSVAVTGTFWQATQPVSAVSLPLPTGAATETTLAQVNTKLPQNLTVKAASIAAVATDPALVVAISPNNTIPVSGTFWQATQPVSAASLPLPTGAATETTLQSLNTKVPASLTVKAASTAAAATDPALVVAISPNNTVPVSLASVPSHGITGNVTVVGTAASGSAASGNPVLIGGSDGTNARSLKVATDGTLLINGVQDQRSSGTITSATSVVGPFSVSNRNVTTIQINGTYAGVTFVIEGTDDGTTWYQMQCINNATGQASATWTPGTNASASYDAAVGGYTSIRIRATAWTSGTAAVGVSNQVFAYDPVVAALSQGLAATGQTVTGNPVLIGGSDGTNARNIQTNTSGHVNIADGGNSITIDSPVGTPAFVRLSNGTSAVDTLPISAASLPLPTGAATETTLSALNTKVPSSLTVKAASIAAAATDPALVVAISPNNTVPVSLASVPSHAVTNAGTFAVQVSSALPTGANVIGAVTQSGTWNIGSITTLPTVQITANSAINMAQVGGVATATGVGTSSTGTIRTVEAGSATGTQSNPSMSTVSATVLAANTNRRGATIFNDSTSIAYIRLSATAATSTVYSIKLNPGDYYEVPSYYNGAITGILNTGTTTMLQVTEIT